MEPSKLAQNSGGSAIREMFNEALKMKETISFTVGEPDFITPQPIIEEACANWKKGLTHYTPNAGLIELRKAVAVFETKLAPDPETEVMISCGATEAIQLALFATVNPGDEVLIITPAWPNYFGQIAMCGATLKAVPTQEENDFVPDIEKLRNAISPKTKMIILNSPCNPTGAVIGKAAMDKIAEILLENQIYIISDEVYSRLLYDGLEHVSITNYPELKKRIIYINSFSKTFAMCGWRLGYAIASSEIIRNMTKLHENGASCLPAPSQLAAARGLEICLSDIERMRTIFEKRRNIICSLIDEIPGMSCRVPKGAFYVFANIIETGLKSKEFCVSLLKSTGVVTVPGSGFGDAGEGFIRFTYATSEENIREGLRRVKGFMENIHDKC